MNFTFDGPEALHIVKRFDLELRKDLARLPNGRNSDPETCDARRKTPDENSKNLNGPSRKKHPTCTLAPRDCCQGLRTGLAMQDSYSLLVALRVWCANGPKSTVPHEPSE